MKTKKKSYSTALFVALVIVILIFTVFQAYSNKNNNPKNTLPFANSQIANNSNTPEILITNPPLEIIENNKNGWMTTIVPPNSTGGYSKFSISYPSDWKLIEGTGDSRFSLFNNGSIIVFNQPSIGGGICLFKDTYMQDVADWYKDNPIYYNFVEIKFKQGKIRRFEADVTGVEDNKKHYMTCELLNGTKLYEAPLNGAVVSIATPINSNSSYLKKIDAILATYKYEK